MASEVIKTIKIDWGSGWISVCWIGLCREQGAVRKFNSRRDVCEHEASSVFRYGCIYWLPDNATSSWTTVKSPQVTTKSLAPGGRVCGGGGGLSRDIISTFHGDPPDDTLHPWSNFCWTVHSFHFHPYLYFWYPTRLYLLSGVFFLTTQQLGFEGWASKFCFGSYIKISFRQELLKSLVVLRSECVFVSTQHYQVSVELCGAPL
jgi:hypothetical protein